MKRLLSIILSLCSLFAFGQVSVGISVSSDSLLIGEPFTVSVKINGDISQIETIDFSSWLEIENVLYPKDTVHLEKVMDLSILDGGVFGISNHKLTLTGDEITALAGDVKVAFYSLGYSQFSNPGVSLKNGKVAMQLQRPIVLVVPPANYSIDSLQLEGIKPIMKEGTHWTDYAVYIYGLLGLLAMFFIGKYLMNRKSTEEDTEQERVPEVIIPAHIKAVEALQKLDIEQLWQKGEVKAYQSELTHIMRAYVTDRYEISALEMTSGELKKALQNLNISDELITSMNDIMQIADIVKFAKGQVGDEINQKFMADAKYWVEKTKQIIIVEE